MYAATPLPWIYLQPLDETIRITNDSTSVTFTCMAFNARSYVWLKENRGLKSNAEGFRSNMLTLHDILPTDNGRYQCVAINDHGVSYSRFAKLTVEGTKTSLNR